MKFVFNSTPLIHLVKAGLAWMIEALEGEKYTTPAVYREVVTIGNERGFDDAPVIESMIKRGLITVKEPRNKFLEFIMKNHESIRIGEAEVIGLAKELEAVAIIDDPVARRIAEIYGVRKEGAYTVIMRMLLKSEINKDQARESLQKLVISGWRCDIEFYTRILRLVEES